nr:MULTISPECIES: YbaB/EbfC family nucleoid-associated protein [Atopobiaceae]
MGGVNMNQLMQQAKKMQEQLAQAQDKAKELEVSASAGGGMVKVVASGDMQLKSIAIDPEALDPDDVELLQDMILAAVNDALNSASEAANSEVASATGLGGMDLGGMGIPGLF